MPWMYVGMYLGITRYIPSIYPGIYPGNTQYTIYPDIYPAKHTLGVFAADCLQLLLLLLLFCEKKLHPTQVGI